jgi:nickel/cobalt transporter (NicO) family protein
MQSLFTLQASFQAKMNALLLALAQGQSGALYAFLGFAFLYGVVHAAGPGHGKAVISSYLLATGETLKRGLWLTGFSSLMQAVSTFFFVGVFYIFFGFGAKTLMNSLYWLEMATALLLIVMGGLIIARRFRHHQNCVHLPPAEQLALKATWREDALLILSIGLRPCTGAVLLLSFALMKGLWFYGALAVLLVAFGTFCAVSLLACLAVYFKKLAVHLAQTGQGGQLSKLLWLESLAGFLLVLLGVLLLLGYSQGEANGFLRRF